MGTVAAAKTVLEEAEQGRLTLAALSDRLDAIEHHPPAYPRWLVALALGGTAASLSRLFGGDWGAFLVAGLAGIVSTWLRLALGGRGANPVLVAFTAALLGGLIGGAGVRLGASHTAALCLVTPAMILVPGVPLINGVQDMIRNHVTLGLSRLGFAGLLVSAIAFGLVTGALVTGVRIPVNAATVTIGLAQDALFSATAAAGFALLFNVPPRLIWACIACGIASHTLRTLLFQLGVDIIVGTLIGSLAAGFLAHGFARAFDAPPPAFAFPGVVAMIPGAYAFRAVVGCLQIARTAASPAVVAETLALAITVALMVAGIAIGIAAPALLAAPFRAARPHR